MRCSSICYFFSKIYRKTNQAWNYTLNCKLLRDNTLERTWLHILCLIFSKYVPPNLQFCLKKITCMYIEHCTACCYIENKKAKSNNSRLIKRHFCHYSLLNHCTVTGLYFSFDNNDCCWSVAAFSTFLCGKNFIAKWYFASAIHNKP